MLETTQNPGLEKLREDADGHQARAESIRKDARPDLGVGISTILVGEDSISGAPESGRDAWMAILSMRLPLWGGGYDERARAALAQRRESEAKRADLMLALENGMERQIFEYEDARDRLNLHQEELIPRQREALRAIMTSWQNGRAELTTFLEGSRLYLSLEREAARARHDLHRAAARAATLSGSAIAPINPEDSSEDFSENFSENSSEKRTRP